MTTLAWPSAWEPAACSLTLESNRRLYRSPISKRPHSVDLLGEFWVLRVSMGAVYRRDSGAIEAYFDRLRMGDDITAHHFARPAPAGTMRGTPTLSGVALQGARSFTLNGAGAGATLKAGDRLSCTGELFEVREDATANGSGVITFTTVNRVRNVDGFANGAAWVWDRPTARFALPPDSPAVVVRHVPIFAEGVEVGLEEVW